jgi:hypothetical protein
MYAPRGKLAAVASHLGMNTNNSPDNTMVLMGGTLQSSRSHTSSTSDFRSKGHHSLQRSMPGPILPALQCPQGDFILMDSYPTTSYPSTMTLPCCDQCCKPSNQTTALSSPTPRRDGRMSTRSYPPAHMASHKKHLSDFIDGEFFPTSVYCFNPSHPGAAQRAKSESSGASLKSWHPHPPELFVSSTTTPSRGKKPTESRTKDPVKVSFTWYRSPDLERKSRHSSRHQGVKGVPPRAPEIPRLSTPEFGFTPRCPDYAFCSCCLDDDGYGYDEEEIRWKIGRVKMDTQRK